MVFAGHRCSFVSRHQTNLLIAFGDSPGSVMVPVVGVVKVIATWPALPACVAGA
jgi:hypothetical protein